MKKILFTLFILINHQALAQNNTPQEMIRDFVQIVGDQIIDVAKDKSLNEVQRKQKIINLIDKSTDSKWIARFVLGKNHKTANEEQKKQFMSMYREFMINTYGPKFNSYDGKKFTVNSVEKQSNFYLVKSEFTPKNSDVIIFVDFRVKENEGNFSIVDFIAEGVSLIETQRSEFNSSINEEGMDKFLINLKKRIDILRLENGKSSIKKSSNK